jgi:hypothetical protein
LEKQGVVRVKRTLRNTVMADTGGIPIPRVRDEYSWEALNSQVASPFWLEIIASWEGAQLWPTGWQNRLLWIT